MGILLSGVLGYFYVTDVPSGWRVGLRRRFLEIKVKILILVCKWIHGPSSDYAMYFIYMDP